MLSSTRSLKDTHGSNRATSVWALGCGYYFRIPLRLLDRLTRNGSYWDFFESLLTT